MTIVLIFLVLYVSMSMWDVMHVNELFDNLVNPGQRRKASAPTVPAPRLVINTPASNRQSS